MKIKDVPLGSYIEVYGEKVKIISEKEALEIDKAGHVHKYINQGYIWVENLGYYDKYNACGYRPDTQVEIIKNPINKEEVNALLKELVI